MRLLQFQQIGTPDRKQNLSTLVWSRVLYYHVHCSGDHAALMAHIQPQSGTYLNLGRTPSHKPILPSWACRWLSCENIRSHTEPVSQSRKWAVTFTTCHQCHSEVYFTCHLSKNEIEYNDTPKPSLRAVDCHISWYSVFACAAKKQGRGLDFDFLCRWHGYIMVSYGVIGIVRVLPSCWGRFIRCPRICPASDNNFLHVYFILFFHLFVYTPWMSYSFACVCVWPSAFSVHSFPGMYSGANSR